jgi:peroxiredoxin
MALTYTPPGELGSIAPHFSVVGTDNKIYSLDSFKDAKGLLVIFMCNHCPYVIAVQERINSLARAYQPRGVAVIGINSNDSKKYPDDSMENMRIRAQEQEYVFPYAQDEDQNAARAFGAVCTPDPFLYENVRGTFRLVYRGRIDDSWKEPSHVTRQDLRDAMEALATGKAVNADMKPSMGCSIKWK